MAKRIGFLGGTFDPPHRGHLQLAELAMQRLDLDRVLLAPAGLQPLKIGDSPAATWPQRLQMIRLAIGERARLEASEIDAPRQDGRPNYSIETLARVRQQNLDCDIFFLLGADAFFGLRRWREPELLLQACELAVASRPGYQLPDDGNELLNWMPEGSRFLGKEDLRAGTAAALQAHVFLCGNALVRLYLMQELAQDIAATDLRALLSHGEGGEWLPGGPTGAVARYIHAQQLYRAR